MKARTEKINDMTRSGFKKDQAPYLVFACSNCGQFSYVKTTQKTKKCLRCGRTHQVRTIKNAETVLGMTAALERVKEKQNQLALNELGKEPDLEGFNTFSIASSIAAPSIPSREHCESEDFEGAFLNILETLTKKHGTFPKYMIELMAKQHSIPNRELEMLISRYPQLGRIKSLEKGYFKRTNF